MSTVVPTLLAVAAIGLFVTALAAMTVGEFLIAGLCFLSASVVIYLRETRLDDEQDG